MTFPIDDERAELELLFDIARTCDKYAELRTALGPVLSLLETRAGLTWGMVTLLDRATGRLKIEEACGLSAEEKVRGVYRIGEGLIGRVFESDQPISVNDLSRDSRFLNRAKNRTRKDMEGVSFHCVPIRFGQALIGTLSAERRVKPLKNSAEQQTAWDRAFLEKVSSIIADSVKLRERIIEEQFRLEKTRDAETAVGNTYAGTGGYITPDSPIIGTGSAMRGVYEMLRQVAPSDATVLITGESGTGKELAAAEVHRLSPRSGKPFITINCAALPESIIESELFGHEKGAFTGAVSRRAGKFEQAHTGTLFLDEISEIPLHIQAKLLRALQEREIERVGGNGAFKVDVRLIAASNSSLEDAVQEGHFREDLFYRLNVFPLRLPPLRERKSDIMLLADHFAEKYAKKNHKIIKRISAPAIDLLTSHSWPGNVRELENCIERAVILSTDLVIHSYNLPPSLQSSVSTHTEPNTTLEAALSRLEKEMIIEALKISEGNMSAASRILGITERQMGLRVHHYGINWKLYRYRKDG